MKTKTAAIILAAGKGTRMKSALPKILHPVCSRPMLLYVLDAVRRLRLDDALLVLGHKHAEVRRQLPGGWRVVLQKGIRGTGDAVKQALPACKSFRGNILVLYGDTPLLKPDTLKRLLKHHARYRPAATILTANMEDPSGYGRILRDSRGSVSAIVEEKDADEFQKTIKEINTGIICFDREKLEQALRRVRPNNRKKEFYLTDTVAILCRTGQVVESVETPDAQEALGINSRVELARANRLMQTRVLEALMKNGVTVVDPAVTFIGYGAEIGRDTVIYPFTVIEKDVKIGARCAIGPFCRLRPGTRLADGVSAGNFIEISRSHFKTGARAKHFGFIGDARIGAGANIGAGTVTANYDGKNKNITRIGDGAFIGSDTVLVAPAKIGKGAKTGAGAVVVKKTVPAGEVFVGVPAKPIKKREK